jgi:mono/diheme cytochrome c family protein
LAGQAKTSEIAMRILAAIGALAIIVGIGAAAFFFGGFYSVAASAEDPAGAKAFAAHGCTTCHGGPGVGWAKLSEGLHPDPPDLKEVVDHRSPAQLFWVVKNGINMTGMPSFALAGAKDEEIWQIVAFLKKLPSVSEADYKSWTAAH